jgi:hypothetical protein
MIIIDGTLAPKYLGFFLVIMILIIPNTLVYYVLPNWQIALEELYLKTSLTCVALNFAYLKLR